MSEVKHSPLPWRAVTIHGRNYVLDRESSYLFEPMGRPFRDKAEGAANTTLVAEAVNSHAVLVAKVADQERLIDDLCRDNGRVPQDATPTERVRAENARLRAALERILSLYTKTDGWKEAYVMAGEAEAALAYRGGNFSNGE